MKRTRYDVEAAILSVARATGGALKTQVVYRANLNFRVAEDYLARLIGAGLLARRSERYSVTELGVAYLERYGELRALLKPREDPELALLRRLHEPI